MGNIRNTIDKFWTKVDKTQTCWIWIGRKGKLNYGVFYFQGKHRYAHRIAYEFIKGPIQRSLVIDHLCRNPSCVNPDHLEAVSQRENIIRGENPSSINFKKTHCVNGHKFTIENTRIRKNGRVCKKCHAIKSNERYYEKIRDPKSNVKNSIKTHCKRGHVLSQENLWPRRDGHRECLICRKDRLLIKRIKYALDHGLVLPTAVKSCPHNCGKTKDKNSAP